MSDEEKEVEEEHGREENVAVLQRCHVNEISWYQFSSGLLLRDGPSRIIVLVLDSYWSSAAHFTSPVKFP